MHRNTPSTSGWLARCKPGMTVSPCCDRDPADADGNAAQGHRHLLHDPAIPLVKVVRAKILAAHRGLSENK